MSLLKPPKDATDVNDMSPVGLDSVLPWFSSRTGSSWTGASLRIALQVPCRLPAPRHANFEGMGTTGFIEISKSSII